MQVGSPVFKIDGNKSSCRDFWKYRDSDITSGNLVLTKFFLNQIESTNVLFSLFYILRCHFIKNQVTYLFII